MKKLVLMAAVLFGAAMVSCGGGDATATVDSDSIKAAEAAAAQTENPAPVDTTNNAAPADTTVQNA